MAFFFLLTTEGKEQQACKLECWTTLSDTWAWSFETLNMPLLPAKHAVKQHTCAVRLAGSKRLGRRQTCALLLLKLKKQEGCNNRFRTPLLPHERQAANWRPALLVISCREARLRPQLKTRAWEETWSEPPCVQFTPALPSSALPLKCVCDRFCFRNALTHFCHDSTSPSPH